MLIHLRLDPYSEECLSPQYRCIRFIPLSQCTNTPTRMTVVGPDASETINIKHRSYAADGFLKDVTGTLHSLSIINGAWHPLPAMLSVNISMTAFRLTVGQSTTASCANGYEEYTIEMYDSFGDGWNGAYMTVVDCDNSSVITTTSLLWYSYSYYSFGSSVSSGSDTCVYPLLYPRF